MSVSHVSSVCLSSLSSCISVYLNHHPPPGRSPGGCFHLSIGCQVDVQLKERIGMNVAKVMSRLDKLKPRIRSNVQGQALPVDRAVHDLIAAAQNETNLAKMSPTFLSFV